MAAGSFSTALSGLNANSNYLNVIGNNLANINTVGFKASTVTFSDLVSQAVGGTSANPMQVGLGVGTAAISTVFSQGAPQTTREASNAAIQGNGFFLIGNAGGGVSYTRDGSFSFDDEGRLVTADGQPVLGWTAVDPTTGQISTNAAPSEILVPPGMLRAPVATTVFSTSTNLSSTAQVGDEFTVPVQIYDALGAPHMLTITYTKTGVGAWDFEITAPGEEVQGGTAGTPFALTTGSVEFDGTGKLSAVNGTDPAAVAITTPAWANGAVASAFDWNVVDANGDATLSGYNSASATSSKTQNGAAPGMIDSISILADGTIQATFGAGQTVAVGKLALATFNNPQGLMKLGANRYGETAASGLANVGEAGSGGRGSLIGSALELSNVDIAQEFTQMILAQRGYQANSKTIVTSDELMVDTLQLKR